MTNLNKIYNQEYSESEPSKGSIESLSKREKELFEMVVSGAPNKKIAENLNISENTVRNHVANIFSKLNNRTEASFLFHKAQLEKYVDPQEKRKRELEDQFK